MTKSKDINTDNERIGTLKSYIEGPKFAGLMNILRKTEFSTGTELTITAHEKGWIRETIYFSFRGEESKLENVRRIIVTVIEDYKISGFTSNNYKVKSVEVTKEHDGQYLYVNLKASKLSGVKALPERIAEELEIPIHIEEKDNGFLKGKTISIRTCGDERKLEIFKQLMQTHLVIKNNTNIYIDTPTMKKFKK